MRRLTDRVLARRACRVVPGSFSMVMATGIVAAALRQDGLTLAADVLLAIAAAAFVVLAAGIGWRLAVLPADPDRPSRCPGSGDQASRGVRGVAHPDQQASPGRAFAAFTFTAACGVLGLGLTTAGLPWPAAVLAAAGALAWLALTALIPVRMAASRRARPAVADVNGTWYLWAVATQSLAIMATFLHAGGMLAAGPAAAVALTVWLAGLVIYLLTTAGVVVRLQRAGIGQPGARAGYWIAMGAVSISVLAAARILGLSGTPVVAAVHPWATDLAIALWSLATCLIPALTVATAMVWLRSGPRPRYDSSAWMVVFPLGMYAAASQQLGTTAGLPAVRLVGEGFTWPAAAVWLAVVALMALPLTSAVGRARVAAGQPGRSVTPQRTRGQGGTRRPKTEPRATRTYQALVTQLSAPGSGDGQVPMPWSAIRAVVRARDHRTHDGRLFTALVSTQDGTAQPANSQVIATMVVVGRHPDDCLGIGDAFTLWRGADMARGVITRRLFT